ncbi:methionine--tRNA ligase, mitochondrial-like, partial [Anneissia japonica]|uniref:methionine--tRNA ligase, mitochondrial-like n=1 Tax=Anneissia japonica TaxID=1529436 RepID=UPI0014256C66
MLLMTLRARPTTRVQIFGHIFGRVQQANSRFLQHRSSSFITTPIFYVNASPHIGHLYSSLLADVTNRWQEICGYSGAIFSTGTDEHGLKVQQTAASRGYSPKVFCDKVSSDFKSIFDLCDISYTDFVRTTEERHRRAVENFWTKLYSAGYIYEGNYKGWYSTSEESFLTPGQVTDAPDGNGLKKISIESGQPVHWTTEHNYMFRLSEFGPRLLQWLDRNQRAIYPTIFADIVREWIQGGLQDLSVSRQRDRLQWGIPVPDDPSQTMSKSIGNVVDPHVCVQRFTADGFRFGLLREDLLHSDGDYSEAKMVAILNAELADTFGNLLSRVTAKSLNPDQIFPEFHTDLFPSRPDGSLRSRASKEDYELIDKLKELPEWLLRLLFEVIMKRFHAIYWPAFLMAAGMPPPKSIICHSHWTRDGSKMSKSIGNVVDPHVCVQRFTADGFRFGLLREDLLHSDGELVDKYY